MKTYQFFSVGPARRKEKRYPGMSLGCPDPRKHQTENRYIKDSGIPVTIDRVTLGFDRPTDKPRYVAHLTKGTAECLEHSGLSQRNLWVITTD